MIKKTVFEDELIYGMQREMNSFAKKEGMNGLVKAAEHLHSALDILDEAGLTVQSDKVLAILQKLATVHEPSNPTIIPESRPDEHFADILDADIDINLVDGEEEDSVFEDSD